MTKLLSATVAANTDSAAITVTPGKIVAGVTDQEVTILAQNEVNSGYQVGQRIPAGPFAFVAPSISLKFRAGSAAAPITVYGE